MTEEQKELLFKDLCGRLPHGVKISIDDNVEILQGINILDTVVEYDSCLSSDIEEVKPYLFPISSMTEEQEREYLNTCNGYCTYYWTDETFDWLHKNHFDYRGLISMGLAIDATGLNIY